MGPRQPRATQLDGRALERGPLPPYTDPSDPHFDFVRATVDFLDQELKGASNLWLYLDVVSEPGLAAFL